MIDNVMNDLASYLEVQPFMTTEDGVYNIDIDQFSVTIRQHSSWIIWETPLLFRFDNSVRHQEDHILQCCMYFFLKTLFDGQGHTLTVNRESQLVLQGRAELVQISSGEFPVTLSDHINVCERYSEILHNNGAAHLL